MLLLAFCWWVLIMVFPSCCRPLLWRPNYLLHLCCLCLFCCCWSPAVVTIPYATGVTTVVDVPSVVGVPAVASVLSVFSIHAVVWHSAVNNGGKFTAIVVYSIPVANLLPVPYLRHSWQICHLCTGGVLWLSNITANFRKNLKWS